MLCYLMTLGSNNLCCYAQNPLDTFPRKFPVDR